MIILQAQRLAWSIAEYYQRKPFMCRLRIYLAAFVTACLLELIQSPSLIAQEATANVEKLCAAASPTENPWTKRLPQGWWKQRHEDS